jgi:phenylalanyl-tRNA synthetase beta chain
MNLEMFTASNGGDYHDSPVEKYHEEMHLALFLTGNKYAENWVAKETPSSFFQLKMFVEQILLKLGFLIDKLRIDHVSNDIFEEGLAYRRGDGKTLVEMGFVHPKRLQENDIQPPVYYADIQWSYVLKALANHKISFAELPKFPSVRRDLALLVDEPVSFAQLKTIASKTERKLTAGRRSF